MFKKDKNIAGIEAVIGLATEELQRTTPGTDEYTKIVEQLDKLNKIATSRKSEPISVNGLVAVGGNLVGIVAILKYEQLHTLTSKALSFVMKSRV